MGKEKEEEMEELARKLQAQQLADSGGEPPARYVLREDDRPIGKPSLGSTIPVVDLSRLFQPDAADEAAKLRSALESWGLFLAVGHEMSDSFLDEVWDVTIMFFQLPIEMKQKYSNCPEGRAFQVEGYGNDEEITEDQILDWTDRLYLSVQPEDARKLDLWPENPSSFRHVLHEFTMKSRQMIECVLSAMAKVLGLSENYFIDQIGERAPLDARFNYYPSCSRPNLVFGVKPHSDGSAITLLLPDKEVEGLQVLKDGEWVNIPIITHAVLIIIGDQIEIMSNGVFKSPMHRVVTNSERERISVAMFYSPEPEKDIEPAEGLVDEKRPRLYKKVKAKEYGSVHWNNFLQGRRGIDWAKV